jgi:hypothetical protein
MSGLSTLAVPNEGIESAPPLTDDQEVADTVLDPATQKKKKKKKPKKSASAKARDAATVTANAKADAKAKDDEAGKPPVLCISRNKHWRYISSYHVRPDFSCSYHFASTPVLFTL